MKLINLNYRAGKNTKVGTPTLPEAMERAVGLMAPDRHVANRVIILVSAVYRSTDIQSVKGRIYFANIFNKKWPNRVKNFRKFGQKPAKTGNVFVPAPFI